MLAIELSTSSDCAREMRGTASIAIAVIGRRPSTSTSSGFNVGASNAISVAPDRIRSSSSSDGVLTPNTTSAFQASPMVAPASTNAVVGEVRLRPGARLDHDLVAELQ